MELHPATMTVAPHLFQSPSKLGDLSFANRATASVVLAYAVFSMVWILLSDAAVLRFTTNPHQIAFVSSIKGGLFVAVTSVLLALLMYRYFKLLASANEKLRASEKTWQFALEGSGDGVWDWSIQTGAAKFSPRWKDMLGYAVDEIGESADEWEKRVHPEDKARVMADLQAHTEGQTRAFAVEFRMHCKDGSWKWVLGRGMVVSRDVQGQAVRLVGTNTDIHERKLLEDGLRFQAQVDYLTGMANRGHFMHQAEQEIVRARRYGKSPSLLMLDVDLFKQVNDAHGHNAGDAVLTKLAEICRQTLRDVDTVGRMGGEEFAVLLPESGPGEALDVAERLRAAVAATKFPIERGLPIQVTVSIGVGAVVSKDDTIDVILSKADNALYEAKNSGRNRVCVAAH